MSATSPFVGVRVFSDLRGSVASIDTRDSTVIGMALPLPNILPADEALFPLDEPVRIATDDPVLIAKLGPGVAPTPSSRSMVLWCAFCLPSRPRGARS